MSLSLPRSERAEVRRGSNSVGDLVVGEAVPLPSTSGRCALGLCARTRRASKEHSRERCAGSLWSGLRSPAGWDRLSCSSYRGFAVRVRNREAVGLGLNSAKRFG